MNTDRHRWNYGKWRLLMTWIFFAGLNPLLHPAEQTQTTPQIDFKFFPGGNVSYHAKELLGPKIIPEVSLNHESLEFLPGEPIRFY
jgi:hypothetical protein